MVQVSSYTSQLKSLSSISHSDVFSPSSQLPNHYILCAIPYFTLLFNLVCVSLVTNFRKITKTTKIPSIEHARIRLKATAVTSSGTAIVGERASTMKQPTLWRQKGCTSSKVIIGGMGSISAASTVSLPPSSTHCSKVTPPSTAAKNIIVGPSPSITGSKKVTKGGESPTKTIPIPNTSVS
ncbi:Uncharacterized protein Fot_02177 [Forsythia ovata]|uniref:Uncharacterized protein n=1 Tax=Forsythia ovata TaxID=205694 RepID=A0ABD1X940_9LAMI